MPLCISGCSHEHRSAHSRLCVTEYANDCGSANQPELICTEETDNAGQSHAVTVASKAGGID